MANQIFIERALDSNGDPVVGAEARFFTTGTTTPVAVYQDTGLSVAHPTPVVSVAGGAWPQVYIASSTAVKIEVRDASSGALLPGYPRDPAAVVSTASSAASGTTFAPITGNATTNVQDAIAVNTNRHETRSSSVKTLLLSSTAAEARTNLGLGNAATVDVIDEDSFSTDSATRPPSQQSTKAYIASAINGRMYESGETVIADGTAYTFTHGLGVIPDFVKLELVCVSSDLGWTAADRIEIGAYADPGSGTDGLSVLKTSTQITVGVGASGIAYMNKTPASGGGSLTTANWKLIVRAFRFS